MDRIDKALFILPFIPILDLASTLLALSLGGQEVGIIGRFFYKLYGTPGLIAWSCCLSLLFSLCIWIFRTGQRRLSQEERASKPYQVLVVITLLVFFGAEAFGIGVVVQNLLVPFLPLLPRYIIWSLASFTYFMLVGFYALSEIKQLVTKGRFAE